jgi:sodium transport system permease protein
MNEVHDTNAGNGDHSVLGTRYSALARVLRMARKELREILRDRRTIITLIAMPILLYPLMFVVFLQFAPLASKVSSDSGPKYRIGLMTLAEEETFRNRLEFGKRALRRGNGKNAEPATAKDKIKRFPQYELKRDRDRPEPRNREERAELLAQMTQWLYDGQIDLIVVIPNLDGAGAAPGNPPATDRWLPCRIISVSNSAMAREAIVYVETLLTAANEDDLKSRFNVPGVTPRITMLTPELVPLEAVGSDGLISLAALVPLVLILMTITGAVYPAIDLTAGERERGTLEILVAAPVPRFELLAAKYISVVTVAVLNAIVNLVCMTITVKFSDVSSLVAGLEGLTPLLLVQIFALLLLFAAFFSAVLLCLTSFARSFKEAQAYLIPLMLASLGPGIMAMMPGLQLEGVLSVLPLVNIVLMARDLFEGGVDPVNGTIVVLTTLLYALAALALAARVFGAESVLYSEQSSWSDLLRRPDEPQKAASIPAMLWCLAVMVPIQFSLFAFLRSLGALPPIVSIFLGIAINLLLFGFLPTLFVTLGRVELRTGLGLTTPRPAALIAGVLLGASLWPLQLWLFEHGGVSKVLEERLGTVMESFREARTTLGWGVLAIVIVPAILEETFFRGLLFNALKARCGAVVTVGVSGLLFGLTHVILAGALGLERLVPSAVLGLILGAVCWYSGSLWPSLIQHVCHNAILLGVGLNEPGSMSVIPLQWLVGGAFGTALGGLLLWQWGRAESSKLPSSVVRGP